MNQAINEEVGAAIKELREQKLRITQTDMASRVGLSRPSLANIEAGRQQISVAQLLDFARALGVSPMAILPNSRREFEQAVTSLKLPKGTPSRHQEWAEKVLSDG